MSTSVIWQYIYLDINVFYKLATLLLYNFDWIVEYLSYMSSGVYFNEILRMSI